MFFLCYKFIGKIKINWNKKLTKTYPREQVRTWCILTENWTLKMQTQDSRPTCTLLNSYHHVSSLPPSLSSIIYLLSSTTINDFMFWINSYYGYAAVNYFFISGNFYFSFLSYSLAQYVTTPKNNGKTKLTEIKS